MSNLLYFLTDIATDPRKQELFERNPTAMIEVAGIPERYRMELSTGDRTKVTAAFVDELQMNELLAVMGSCCGWDPGPDPFPDPDPNPIPEPAPSLDD